MKIKQSELSKFGSDVCGNKTAWIDMEIFTLKKKRLPQNIFNVDGRLNPAALLPFGNLGYVDFLDVTLEELDVTVITEIQDECIPPQTIEGIIKLQKVNIVVTVAYDIILANAFSDPTYLENSQCILDTTSNFITLKIDGFAYTTPGADVSKYFVKENYKLTFQLTATPDQYAPVSMPFVGVVTTGTVTLAIQD